MARDQGQKTSNVIILSNNPRDGAFGQYYYNPTAENGEC